MRRILLDTNAYSALMRGSEEVLQHIVESEAVYLSHFVIGELLAGFMGGSREQENRAALARFVRKSTVQILLTSYQTAERFAFLRDSLRKAGTPLPINDIWIGAHGLECGAEVVTADNHFAMMPGVMVCRLSAWMG